MSCLVDQSQDCAGDALLNMLGRHLDNAVVHVANPLADGPIGFGAKALILGREFIPK